jgi:hypothetical protein
MADDRTKDGPGQGTDGAGGAQQKMRLKIKAAEEIARGVYANLALVHNKELEFVLDFVFVEPQRPAGQVVSRVVTNPRTAKLLLKGMQEMVRRYEERFGEIALPEQPPPSGAYH